MFRPFFAGTAFFIDANQVGGLHKRSVSSSPRSAGSFFAIKKPPGLHSGGGSKQINKIIDYDAIIQIAKNN